MPPRKPPRPARLSAATYGPPATDLEAGLQSGIRKDELVADEDGVRTRHECFAACSFVTQMMCCGVLFGLVTLYMFVGAEMLQSLAQNDLEAAVVWHDATEALT